MSQISLLTVKRRSPPYHEAASEIPVATTTTLIDDIVRISGFPQPTLQAYVQELRKTELIGPTQAGGAARPVVIEDLAALLAAILAHPTIADAAKTTTRALQLPQHSARFFGRGSGKVFWDNHLDAIGPADLAQMETFGDALLHLLQQGEQFCKQKEKKQKGLTLFFDRKTILALQIDYHRPAGVASITFHLSRTSRLQVKFNEETVCHRYEHTSPILNAYDAHGASKHQDVITKTVASPTLLAYVRSMLKNIHPR
jgi:hypothetical protein